MKRRILGIDPGSRICGFGVIDIVGNQRHYVASGAIRTPQGASLAERVKVLVNGIHQVIDTYQPTEAALEQVFVNVNPAATLMLGQARGACLAALVSSGLPVAEYTALQMKKAVAGHGRANKAQIQEMTRRLLNLSGLPGTDAADALGLAIMHAHAGQAMARLAEATPLQRRTHALFKGGRSY